MRGRTRSGRGGGSRASQRLRRRAALEGCEVLFVAFRRCRSFRGPRRRLFLIHDFFFFMTYSSAFRSGALYQRAERPSAQQMQVQVIHLLSAVRIAIDDETGSRFSRSALSGQIASHDDHMPMRDSSASSMSSVVGMASKDDQQVYGRGGTDVHEGDHAANTRYTISAGSSLRDDLLKKCGHFYASESQGPQEYQERAALPGGAAARAPCCNAICNCFQ